MRTSNPTLSAFEQPVSWSELGAAGQSRTMTIEGTAIAAGVLLAMCAVTAILTWSLLSPGAALSHLMLPAMLTGIVGGFIGSLITRRSPRIAPVTGPIVAVFEGVFLGAVSLMAASMLQAKFGGMVGLTTIFQAVLLTFSIFTAVLIGYATGILRFGGVVKKCIIVATAGIMVFYGVSLVLWLLGVANFAAILSFDNASPISIGFSLFVVVLASANLVLDFDLISEGVEQKQPKYMEWYGGFALMITLVWLYFEVLRLLVKLRHLSD
jgi:uncharacterized YccA/Bax inhibitor family protein